MQSIKFENTKVDPCLYYKWDSKMGLILWLSWVDDCLCVRKEEAVRKEKKDSMNRLDCEDIEGFDEYVGCKVKINKEERLMKFIQPVLLQSFHFKIVRSVAVLGDCIVDDSTHFLSVF
jgi:hypothetical protein